MAHIDNPALNGRILKVYVCREADTVSEGSDIGRYSDKPGPEDRTIDREEIGDRGRGEHRYFVAAMSAYETGNPESVRQDYARAEALNRGEWGYIGIVAKAVIVFPGSNVVQRLTSGGLWGIESDSGEDYLKATEEEELGALRGELAAAGFSEGQIDLAFEDVKRRYEIQF